MKYQDLIATETRFYSLSRPFILESGESLSQVQIAYRTWGTLNPHGDNAVIVCHAFTGWADVDEWWPGLLGGDQSLDPQRDFIICSNILGSCYGTTGPSSINPQTGVPYGPTFPKITIRDMVNLQGILADALGVRSISLVIGGSLGGMQALEWALLYPDKVKAIAVIAASGRHSAWCIGLGEAQRQAIYGDPRWNQGHYTDEDPPVQGLAIARMMAMSTYRSWTSFSDRFGRELHSEEGFKVSNYLHHHGQKLVDRFDANTYITLSLAMDSHDVGRDREDYDITLGSIQQPALIVTINSDILYPPIEQQELATFIPNAQLGWLNSSHGHDGFLIDMEELNQMVLDFRQSLKLEDNQELGFSLGIGR